MQRFILAMVLSGAALWAQPQYSQAQGGQDGPIDPPSRVARLNWISGDVAFQPATVDTWTNATVNYPLTTGDHLFVNDRARAELHIGATAIRINSISSFGFLNLSDDTIQMSLNQGSMEIRLRQLDRDDIFEIDTPNGAVTLLRAGDYRIDTDPARNATMVTVRTGQAEVYQEGNSMLVTARQTAWFHDGSGPEINPENPRDEFDRFIAMRNNAEDALPRGEYVPETMVGYQDLYAYGRWVNDPVYGSVWVPPVDTGWAPYTLGRWAFVEPWGWTWIDEEPWGFAPFHYGRWAMLRGGWGGGWAWIPGERSYRPVYAPALVGFIGGGGFGVSIGWFPLGPREPWIPAWGASGAYVNRVNVMHVTNVNVVNVTYVNRQNAVVVSQADFAGARSVRGAMRPVTPGEWQGARVLGTSPQIVPGRASVAFGPQRAAPPLSARVVVAKTPPPAAPVSFEARQRVLTQNQGLPLSANQVGQLRSQQPGAVVNRQPVRAIGGQQGGPAMNRPANPGFTPNSAPAIQQPANPNRLPDRMNSRPPNALPPPANTQPGQYSPRGQQPQTTAPPAVQAAPQNSAPANQQPGRFPQRDQPPQQVPQSAPPAQRVQPAPQPAAPPAAPPAPRVQQPATPPPAAQPAAPPAAQPAPQNRPIPRMRQVPPKDEPK